MARLLLDVVRRPEQSPILCHACDRPSTKVAVDSESTRPKDRTPAVYFCRTHADLLEPTVDA